MIRPGSGRERLVRAAVAAVAVIVPALARADALSLTLEPSYRNVFSRTTDQAGARSSQREEDYGQTYRLSLNKDLSSTVRFTGDGLFQDTRTTYAHGDDGNDLRATTLSGGLTFGDRLLGGNLSASHRQEDRSGAGGSSGLRNDTFGLVLGWAPAELPSWNLRLQRANIYDRTRQVQDSTSDDAMLSFKHSALGARLTVDGGGGVNDTHDRVGRVETRVYTGNGRATYGDKLFGGLTMASVTWMGSVRASETMVRGAGGYVLTTQAPSPGGGLSLVEEVTVTPATDTLERNPALVDGNSTASAGINIGFRPSAALDTRLRDLGAEFPDAQHAVNRILVWVDRPLTDTVALSYAWSAWVSDDNLTWTQTSVAGPATFGTFENRFEIPLLETISARFIKVVVRPLPVGVTLDDRFRDIFVTEVQFTQRETAEAAAAVGRSTTVTNQVTASARTAIPAVQGLAHEFSTILRRNEVTDAGVHTSQDRWVVSNGLALTRNLQRWLLMTSRVRRDDSDDGRGRIGVTSWSSSLGAKPIETLTSTLAYTGSYSDGYQGNVLQNAATLFTRAQVYAWLGVIGNLGYQITDKEGAPEAQAMNARANVDVVPHRTFRLAGIWMLQRTAQAGVVRRTASIQGNASWAPTDSTSFGGSVLRIYEGTRPTTLGSVSAALSPFQGGSLQLTVNASRTLDTASDQTTSVASTGARWTLHPGWYIDSRYAIVGIRTGAVARQDSREFTISLFATAL